MEKERTQFDALADDYYDNNVKALGWFGKYRETALVYKSQLVKHITGGGGLKSIVDFGCGVGLNIPYLHKYFPDAKIYGCDVSAESLKIAAAKYPYADFKVIKTTDDLREYSKIDCVFIATVFHHIPPREHEYWMTGLSEIINNGGYLFIFEHNMKNPLTNMQVKKKDENNFDDPANMLSSKYCQRLVSNYFMKTKITKDGIKVVDGNVKLRYTYFFPWRNKFFTFIEHLLLWLPVGAQYCVWTRKQ